MDVDANDFNSLRKLAAGVIDGLLAGKVPPYIDRDELIGECITRLPSLLDEYGARNGASLGTFLKKAWRNDALNFIDKERRRRKYLVDDPIRPTNSDSDDENDDVRSPEDQVVFEQQQREGRAQDQDTYQTLLRADVFERASRLLTREQFSALMLCYRAGLTERQAGQELGTTREAIHSRLGKATQKLKADFQKNPPHLDPKGYHS